LKNLRVSNTLPSALRVVISARCVGTRFPAPAVDDLDHVALSIEMQVTLAILEYLDGIVIVDRVIVDYDPSSGEEDCSDLME
jgi:hypothetical protein